MRDEDRKSFKDWQRECYATSAGRGFHDDPPDAWKFAGNLMAEAAEVWEEVRKPDFDPTRTYYGADGSPEGMPAELADVAIRLLDTCETYGIDLEAAIAEKNAYNRTRPRRHGGKRA